MKESVCNNKYRWNNDKCKCECKKLIHQGIYDKGFIWNPGNCECKCDKSCDVGEYLNYKDCKCREKLIDKLVKEYSEDIDRNEMIYNTTSNEEACNSCTICIVLLAIAL